jgi:hypothetical protein
MWRRGKGKERYGKFGRTESKRDKNKTIKIRKI